MREHSDALKKQEPRAKNQTQECVPKRTAISHATRGSRESSQNARSNQAGALPRLTGLMELFVVTRAAFGPGGTGESA